MLGLRSSTERHEGMASPKRSRRRARSRAPAIHAPITGQAARLRDARRQLTEGEPPLDLNRGGGARRSVLIRTMPQKSGGSQLAELIGAPAPRCAFVVQSARVVTACRERTQARAQHPGRRGGAPWRYHSDAEFSECVDPPAVRAAIRPHGAGKPVGELT